VGAVVYPPGGGERIAVGPSSVTIKATTEDTAGSLYLGETSIVPGFPGPPLHVHDRLHDMFYVLEGTLTMQVGDESHELGPGSFACIPPGVAHTFSNRGEATVRFLNFNTPGGWESYMRDLGAAGTPTPEEIGRIASRYDFRIA